MTKTNLEIEEEFNEEFDKHFYQKDRIWMSRDGESYGSTTPEMGRGELFRFIKEFYHSLLQQRMDEIEGKIRQVKEKVKKKVIKIPKWVKWVDCSKDGYIIFNSEVR